MTTVSLALPYPPSVNRIWRAVNGRNIKSAEYRDWLTQAGWSIPSEAKGAVSGPYGMVVKVDRPDRRRRDLSNTLKVVEDALQQAGVIRDDSDAQIITLAWSDRAPGNGAKVHVSLWPAVSA